MKPSRFSALTGRETRKGVIDMKELTIQDLEGQSVELLPSRETLYFGGDSFNWAGVHATNTSVALNAASLLSSAESAAYQSVAVIQH
jgi:hypothetical protein